MKLSLNFKLHPEFKICWVPSLLMIDALTTTIITDICTRFREAIYSISYSNKQKNFFLYDSDQLCSQFNLLKKIE